MINHIVLVGRMVADPELRYTPSGVAMSRFRIAVNRQFPNAQGEREADFIDIIAWRQSAQFAADYLRKGRLVGVEGRLQVRSFTTQEGQRRRMYEVVANSVQALERARQDDSAPTHDDAPASQNDYNADDDTSHDNSADVFEGQ